MQKLKLTLVAATAATLGLAGVGTALASQGSSTPRPSNPSITAPADTAGPADTDNVQEGDQTTPDTAAEATETTGSETASSETASSETAGESAVDDGNDGGHADPEGVDVNHEGGADEK